MTQDTKLKQFKIIVPMHWDEFFTIDARDIQHARDILDASLCWNNEESKNFQEWIAEGCKDNWGDASPEYDNIELMKKDNNGNTQYIKLNKLTVARE